MSRVLALYRRAERVPVLGRAAFSLAFAVKAPYFLTIVPTVLELRPNYARVRVRKWWGVHNHIGTVHAIAVANGLELAMGALAEATIPAGRRWLPKGMELDYLAKSTTTLTAIAETDPSDWERLGEVSVRVRAERADGTVVVAGRIRLHVSERPG